MNIDSLTIYCLATGKPIAQINDDETGMILESLAHIPAFMRDRHLESMCLASMRPSLLWMNVTAESLRSIEAADPKQLLAYLLNRMYASVDLDRYGKPFHHEDYLQARRTRIAIWQTIQDTDFGTDMDQLLLVLLELDSRFNLAKINRPVGVNELWDSCDKNIPALLEALLKWRDSLVDSANKKARQDKLAAEFWSEGNRHTRQVFQHKFMTVNPTKAQVAKVEKAAKVKDAVDFLDSLEAEFAQTGGFATTIAEPVAVKKIVRFGVKREAA